MVATVEQLADANMAQVSRLTNRVLALAEQAWWALSDWHTPDDFVTQFLPLLQGAQIQTAALQDAYIAAIMAEATGMVTAPIGLAPELVTDLRMNTTMAEAYSRPFHTVWFEQGKGTEFPQALRLGLDRLQHMVSLDIQLARTHASALILQQTDGVQRYQRVLSGSENCDICSVASKHIYKSSSLMPIHTKCDCTVAPVIEGRPPLANRINRERDFTAPDSETDGAEKKSPTQIAADVGIEDHGELGPVLVRKQQTYPSFNPGPDGTWQFEGRVTAKEAGVKIMDEDLRAKKDVLAGLKEISYPSPPLK